MPGIFSPVLLLAQGRGRRDAANLAVKSNDTPDSIRARASAGAAPSEEHHVHSRLFAPSRSLTVAAHHSIQSLCPALIPSLLRFAAWSLSGDPLGGVKPLPAGHGRTPLRGGTSASDGGAAARRRSRRAISDGLVHCSPPSGSGRGRCSAASTQWRSWSCADNADDTAAAPAAAAAAFQRSIVPREIGAFARGRAPGGTARLAAAATAATATTRCGKGDDQWGCRWKRECGGAGRRAVSRGEHGYGRHCTVICRAAVGWTTRRSELPASAVPAY